MIFYYTLHCLPTQNVRNQRLKNQSIKDLLPIKIDMEMEMEMRYGNLVFCIIPQNFGQSSIFTDLFAPYSSKMSNCTRNLNFIILLICTQSISRKRIVIVTDLFAPYSSKMSNSTRNLNFTYLHPIYKQKKNNLLSPNS